MDPDKYRSAEDKEKFRKADPIVAFEHELEEAAFADEEYFKQVRQEVDAEVQRRDPVRGREPRPEPRGPLQVHLRRRVGRPPRAPAGEGLMATARAQAPTTAQAPAAEEKLYRVALREALDEEMERDDIDLPHRRGHREVRRRISRDRGPARQVRGAARGRCADRRRGHRRDCDRRGHAGPAPGGRADDHQLLAGRLRPDRQQRGQDPLHVRRRGPACRW